MDIPKIGLFESFLVQILIYGTIWMFSEYIGIMICIVIPVISTAILLISLIVERIEKSNISKLYFLHMLVFIISPIIVALAFSWIYQGKFDWIM